MAVKGQIEPWKILLILLGAGGFGVLLWLLIVNINSKKPATKGPFDNAFSSSSTPDYANMIVQFDSRVNYLSQITNWTMVKPGFLDQVFSIRQQLLDGNCGSDGLAACRSYDRILIATSGIANGPGKGNQALLDYYNLIIGKNRPTCATAPITSSDGTTRQIDYIYILQELADKITRASNLNLAKQYRLVANVFSVRNNLPFVDYFMKPIFVMPGTNAQTSCSTLAKNFMVHAKKLQNVSPREFEDNDDFIAATSILNQLASNGCIDPIDRNDWRRPVIYYYLGLQDPGVLIDNTGAGVAHINDN